MGRHFWEFGPWMADTCLVSGPPPPPETPQSAVPLGFLPSSLGMFIGTAYGKAVR